jgi:hypothetical protein
MVTPRSLPASTILDQVPKCFDIGIAYN